MRTKKGFLGFEGNIGQLEQNSKAAWFDLADTLVRGETRLPEKSEYGRAWWAYGFIVLVVVIFGFRLTQLQISQGNQNRLLADGNRVRREFSISARGAIVDAKGQDLVTNIAGYQFTLIPADLPYSSKDRLAVLQKIAQLKNIKLDDLTKKINQVGLTSHDPLTLVSDLSRDDALLDQIRFANVPGVQIAYVPSRQYDTTPGLSHILGYTSQMTDTDIQKHPDYFADSPIGRVGLEASYDANLRGTIGVNDIEVNATGQFQRLLQSTPPKVGDTLHLTLDKGLENAMAQALKKVMDEQKVKQGVGVALDPQTGGILAAVSLPDYNDNLFSRGISQNDYSKLANDPDKPLLDQVIAGEYPSGSTIKPFIAAAALQEKTINASTTLDTSAGAIKVGGSVFPDWKVHGVTDVAKAIAQSNDFFFYALGGGYNQIPGLGIERIDRYLSMFGFGKDTGVDYGSEASGTVPSPATKQQTQNQPWYLGDTYHVSIGQGDLLVTPLQMAQGLASLVNGGRLITPHIVASLEDPLTHKITPLKYAEQKITIDDSTLATVRQGMSETVESDFGSAQPLKKLPFTSGGKTGTAEYGGNGSDKTHAWYIGYAPLDNPKIVVAILVPGGGEGNAIAAPVAGDVFQAYLSQK